MDTVQVKKIVAICFLEAVKMSLDHLGSHRMSLAHENVGGSGDLPKLYGEVRRLRDYVQRCVSAYQDIAELDLPGHDRALLVASCRRYIDAIDARLAGAGVADPKERQFLLKKQQVIADWTVELAAKPLIEFPLPRLAEVQGDGGRALKTRIQEKLYALHEQSIISRGTIKTVGGGEPDADQGQPPAKATTAAAPNSNSSESEFPAESVPMAAATGDPSFGSPEPVKVPFIDTNALHDPRLRALVAMDLRSLELVEKGDDHRLATVLMATILEAAVLDYAIPRRAELQLTGGPDTWHPQEVLFKVLGDGVSPTDRSLAYSLFYSRRLLSPAQQIVAPMVATSSSVKGLRDFVENMLHQLGFARSARTAAPDSSAYAGNSG